MQLVRLGQRYTKVQILGGNFDGKRKLIPRILLATTYGRRASIYSHTETVNKSQGQTVGRRFQILLISNCRMNSMPLPIYLIYAEVLLFYWTLV